MCEGFSGLILDFEISKKFADFYQMKNADIGKSKCSLMLKAVFSKTTCACTYVPNFKFLA